MEKRQRRGLSFFSSFDRSVFSSFIRMFLPLASAERQKLSD
ncbi:hypothetical protein [Escherichia coli]|nr:hypothetical protein [Escherichia coli]